MTTNGSGPAGAVVVTGASTGIGEACALRLDSMGFIVFAGVRKEADGQALRQKASSRLTPVMLDVTDSESITAAARQVGDATGGAGLSGLVNNAGISVAGPLEFVPIDELRRQLEVNVVGQVAVTQAFLPLLRLRRGRIVNIGSVSGRLATPFVGPYAASKFAMEAVTDALRIELRPWRMHVAIVEPGSIATPIWDKARSDADRLMAALPERAHRLYDDAVRVMLSFADETAKRGIAPDAVAKAVAHALTAKQPKTRYLVGTDARLQAVLAKLVPDRLRDTLIQRQLKLPAAAPDATAAEEAAPAH
ncbi:MAG TPA: SDR family oxidoreductase [Dehalococcoidia bacterium]|nr:SDR family oxidoreductase [Dehalococcoidia bacterium]